MTLVNSCKFYDAHVHIFSSLSSLLSRGLVCFPGIETNPGNSKQKGPLTSSWVHQDVITVSTKCNWRQARLDCYYSLHSAPLALRRTILCSSVVPVSLSRLLVWRLHMELLWIILPAEHLTTLESRRDHPDVVNKVKLEAGKANGTEVQGRSWRDLMRRRIGSGAPAGRCRCSVEVV